VASADRSVPPMAAIADYPLQWRWRTKLGERLGHPCRITARSRQMASVRVEFPDGFFVITSWRAVKRRG